MTTYCNNILSNIIPLLLTTILSFKSILSQLYNIVTHIITTKEPFISIIQFLFFTFYSNSSNNPISIIYLLWESNLSLPPWPPSPSLPSTTNNSRRKTPSRTGNLSTESTGLLKRKHTEDSSSRRTSSRSKDTTLTTPKPIKRESTNSQSIHKNNLLRNILPWCLQWELLKLILHQQM